MSEFGPIKKRRRGADEPFQVGGQPQAINMLNFWQWSFSDIVSNATRGVLAEFIVAEALGVAAEAVREEWAPFDLVSADGTTVEVKSSAFIQSWSQERASDISYGIPQTRALIEGTNRYSEVTKRQAEVYVFALLAHMDQATLDPLSLDQWEFYVVPTSRLDDRFRSQRSLRLSVLRELAGKPVCFSGLRQAISGAGVIHRAHASGQDVTGMPPDEGNRSGS